MLDPDEYLNAMEALILQKTTAALPPSTGIQRADRAQAPRYEVNRLPVDMRSVPITLNVFVAGVTFRDQFDWDLTGSHPRDPVLFAREMCKDLGFDGVVANNMANSIKEQIVSHYERYQTTSARAAKRLSTSKSGAAVGGPNAPERLASISGGPTVPTKLKTPKNVKVCPDCSASVPLRKKECPECMHDFVGETVKSASTTARTAAAAAASSAGTGSSKKSSKPESVTIRMRYIMQKLKSHISSLNKQKGGDADSVINWADLEGKLQTGQLDPFMQTIKQQLVKWSDQARAVSVADLIEKWKTDPDITERQLRRARYKESDTEEEEEEMEEDDQDGDEEPQYDDDNMDFCGVCGETGELLCCDSCPSSYHTRCVGMSKLPEGDWFCWFCRLSKEGLVILKEFPKPAERALYNDFQQKTASVTDKCRMLVRLIMKHPCCRPFKKPVDIRQEPEYYKIISNPMDLSTIQKKLADHQYKTTEELLGDFKLVWANCKKFNEEGSVLWKYADSVQAVIDKVVGEVMPGTHTLEPPPVPAPAPPKEPMESKKSAAKDVSKSIQERSRGSSEVKASKDRIEKEKDNAHKEEQQNGASLAPAGDTANGSGAAVDSQSNRLEDNDESMDYCAECGDGGDLMCCDKCPLVWHLACIDLETIPEGDWFCPACTSGKQGTYATSLAAKRNKKKRGRKPKMCDKCNVLSRDHICPHEPPVTPKRPGKRGRKSLKKTGSPSTAGKESAKKKKKREREKQDGSSDEKEEEAEDKEDKEEEEAGDSEVRKSLSSSAKKKKERRRREKEREKERIRETSFKQKFDVEESKPAISGPVEISSDSDSVLSRSRSVSHGKRKRIEPSEGDSGTN
eukprot:GILK01006855.1.p1 GENE.GILK01006855.1~~GILK01006855.1.p1  ORF type:complete len:854 (-),score=175.20 GILK01006855.1:90-2651(-)